MVHKTKHGLHMSHIPRITVYIQRSGPPRPSWHTLPYIILCWMIIYIYLLICLSMIKTKCMGMKECRWLLREGIFETVGKLKKHTGKYTGRVFCTYTCSESAEIKKPSGGDREFVTYEKVLKSDVSCCPYLSDIAMECPILEQARVLEAFYRK
jgi:hypothetical protein